LKALKLLIEEVKPLEAQDKLRRRVWRGYRGWRLILIFEAAMTGKAIHSSQFFKPSVKAHCSWVLSWQSDV
jgi:hypothetical protein